VLGVGRRVRCAEWLAWASFYRLVIAHCLNASTKGGFLLR